MKRLAVIGACLAAFAGCNSAPETSGYEPGDYVVYKYYGSYRPEPLFVTKKVLSKTGGNKLEILVEWKSGKEARSWKEFVTDTPYNRANNVVDRLVTLNDGKETELPNKENLDLFRFYDGTYIIPQHAPRLVGEDKKNLRLGVETYPCRVRTYKTRALNRRARMTVTDCERFKWGEADRRYTDRGGGTLYAMEAVECGNRK